jgi:hypothetical protein
MQLRLMPVLLPLFFALKTLKYTKYSCGFQISICSKTPRHPLLLICALFARTVTGANPARPTDS